MIATRHAVEDDIVAIAPLFDAYRVFYGQPTNLSAASSFLKERFSARDSVILLAVGNGEICGFTQLYKSFSSVSLKAIFILNDLFVAPEFREKGVGKALLTAAQNHCKLLGYKGLALETATENPAQKLYEKMGWVKDEACFHYFWQA